MKFLIDAQLPRRLARRLQAAGHDAIHTLDLPTGNRTPDEEICRIADSDGRAVVTKDADFVSHFLLTRKPQRLVLVSVGNTTNDDLERRLFAELPGIARALFDVGFVELTNGGIVVHEG
jgi:predicted nuclease of predicted toxin-antitoxin system